MIDLEYQGDKELSLDLEGYETPLYQGPPAPTQRAYP
jgi:hypothetical protein